MKLLHRKSRWQRLIKPVAAHAPSVGRSGLTTLGTALGTAVGMTAASAVVSSIRHRQDGS